VTTAAGEDQPVPTELVPTIPPTAPAGPPDGSGRMARQLGNALTPLLYLPAYAAGAAGFALRRGRLMLCRRCGSPWG
jgi:hypothetical protein